MFAVVKKGTDQIRFKRFAQSNTLRGMVYISKAAAGRALGQIGTSKDQYEVKKYNLGESNYVSSEE